MRVDTVGTFQSPMRGLRNRRRLGRLGLRIRSQEQKCSKHERTAVRSEGLQRRYVGPIDALVISRFCFFLALISFTRSHNPKTDPQTYDPVRHTSHQRKVNAASCLGLLSTVVSLRISALAAAIPSGLHDYRVSATNHSSRSKLR